MCGARIGCLVSKNPEIIKTVIKFAQARLSPPTFALLASEAALDTPQSYFDMVIEEYEARRDLLVEALGRIDGVAVAKPRGAFYCMASLPVADTEDFARWLLQEYSFEGSTVMVAPAAGFYATPGLGRNEVRIAYVLEKTRLLKAARILEEALKTYRG
jgi:aspartate aminotransferase